MFHRFRDPGADGVGIAFSDREGGVSAGTFASLNLGRSDLDTPEAVAENYRRLREAAGIGPLFTLHQVHGADVVEITPEDVDAWMPGSELGDAIPGQATLPVGDALVTRVPGVALAVRVADCIPVLFADPAAGVLGAAHAGRKGIEDEVLAATVAQLRRIGGTRLTAWIGPHACGTCYELPEHMVAALADRWPEARSVTERGTPAADLGAVAEVQLRGEGCDVVRWDACTMTTASLYSHRRDGARTGRQIGVVWGARVS